MSYTFVNDFNDTVDRTIVTFLQITIHPNPKTKKYHVRKFKINNEGNFVDIKNYYLSKNKYDKLLKSKKQHEYKLYSVYTLEEVPYPSESDILLLNSSMLKTSYNYYGSAPF